MMGIPFPIPEDSNPDFVRKMFSEAAQIWKVIEKHYPYPDLSGYTFEGSDLLAALDKSIPKEPKE